MITIPRIRGYRSRAINALASAIERNRPIPGPGLLATQGPAGTVLSLARPPADPASAFTLWAPIITHNPSPTYCTISFDKPWYLRSPLYRFPTSPTFDLVPAATPDGLYYCAVTILLLTNAIDTTLRLAKTASSVVFTNTLPTVAEALTYRLLVCTLTHATVDSQSIWSVTDRCIISIPELGHQV